MKKINIKSICVFARQHGDFLNLKENAKNLIRKDKKYILVGNLDEEGKVFVDLATGEKYPLDAEGFTFDGDKYKSIKKNRDYELSYLNKKGKVAVYLECKNKELMGNDFFFLEYLSVIEQSKPGKAVCKIFDYVAGENEVSEKEAKLVEKMYNNMIEEFYHDLQRMAVTEKDDAERGYY